MKIGEIRALRGPNIYSYKPVLLMPLQLETLYGKETHEFSGFHERLLALLPGLHEHHCSQGEAGGLLKRLEEGIWFGHLVEHVALELTELAGVGVFHGKTRAGVEPGSFNIVIEYRAEEGTKYLLREAVTLVETLLRGHSYPLNETIRAAKQLIAKTELGPSTRAIVNAAQRRNIPWQRLDEESLVQLGYGQQRRFIAAAMSSQTSALAVDIVSDKDRTKRLLDRAGIPVPRGAVVRDAEEAVHVMEWLHKPVAVKPFNGCQGKGVSLNLYTPEQVTEAFHIACKYSPEVLVEELFVGRDFRVLIVNGQLIAASERIPAEVTGDGEHTIAELIETENNNPLRGEGHCAALTRIEIDEVMTAYLQKNNLSLTHVPATGEHVRLRENANLSKGGTAVDVTDEVHPGVRQVCERAARLLGLDICGIDLVLPSITEPIGKNGAGIIEINAAPGLRMHTSPSIGHPRDVGAAIIEMLYPQDATGRIPIVSVTGTNGKTTITRLIGRMLMDVGTRVGMTTTDGIYINEELIVAGDTTGPRSTQIILSDPTVEAAVLEVARGGIMRGGLGYDWADISVLSNIQADHLGQDGLRTLDDVLFVKSLVAERVRAGGTLILNADDKRLAQLAEHPRVSQIQKHIVYYSLFAQHPLLLQHIERGGKAYALRDGWLVEFADDAVTKMIEAAQIPLTFGGTAAYQISNALAALAAGRAYGLSAEQCAATLRNATGTAHNSGRGNLYQVGQGRVLVDYGHNPTAFEVVGNALRGMKAARLTAVLGVPGDRNDEMIQAAGVMAAHSFDRLILKEDKDRRGRKVGEVVRLLSLSAKRTRPVIECRLVLDEREALELALRDMQPEEIVAVFYEKLDVVLDVLQEFGAVPATISNAEPLSAGASA